jgi:hypothetical protein
MNGFRLLLALIFTSVVVYTVPVLLNHGPGLLAVFFGDIARMGWPGQFNLDFLGFLILSAVWVAWRNQFSTGGLGLAVLALFFGAPFLTLYLLIISFRTQGDVRAMLLGVDRARATAGGRSPARS